MRATLVEGEIRIVIPRVIQYRKFDEPQAHGLTNCMKAVDFVVELRDRILFIEIKDPSQERADPARRNDFVKGFENGNLDESLKYKYRDSFLYEWASDRVKKPIHYYVLVALDGLSDAFLLLRTDELKRKLPLRGPASGSWSKNFAESCVVFSIASWNRFLPQYHASRVSP